MTKDGNLKREVFDAFSKADLVIHEGRVIKTGVALVSQSLQEAVKRVRRAKATEVVVNPSQTAPEPQQEPVDQFATSVNDAS